MKTLLLTLLLLTPVARAAGPDYQIPRGATSHPETCFRNEVVREAEASGWGEWKSVVSQETHQSTFWNEGDYFYALQRANDGRSAVYSRFQETALDRSFTQRRKETTRWTKNGNEWIREDFVTDVQITKREGDPVRVVESTNGTSLIWDVRTYGDGEDQVTERTLRNPSAFSTEMRKVGNHTEICRFRLGF
jgi:hypothetical protein